MNSYHCSIYAIGAGLRASQRGGTRQRKTVDPVRRLNAIATWWKRFTGDNRVFTWQGYRSQTKALSSSRERAVEMTEYE